jgi:hypothetical protein
MLFLKDVDCLESIGYILRLMIFRSIRGLEVGKLSAVPTYSRAGADC